MVMKIDLRGILEGAWNSVFVKEEIERIATRRIEICKACPHNSDYAKTHRGYSSIRPDFHCTICKCDLYMKTRCLSCECPIKKWVVEVSDEEDLKIQEKLENGQDDKN